jgi:ABC-type polysaccharide/polyol phosphate transport system ATPase subunit
MSAPLVELSNVSKRFSIPQVRRDTLREHLMDFFRPHPHERLDVLQEISFAIRRGESVGLMGRNGCGKSTLLRVVSGIYPPDSGTVTLRAPVTPILELGVGWNPELDAVDNIYLLASVMGMSLPQIRSAVDEILAFAELERFANLALRHYSSGMGARLAYSVAFRAVREVLILDEVFAVGDAGFKERCEARYRQLHAAGHTMLLVSHEPHIIQSFCSRALLLERGRLVLDGPGSTVTREYERLFEHPATP